MSNPAAIEEALANGWLDQEDLAVLKRVPLDSFFCNESERQEFYGLSLENKCVMIRHLIHDQKGYYER